MAVKRGNRVPGGQHNEGTEDEKIHGDAGAVGIMRYYDSREMGLNSKKRGSIAAKS